MSLILRIENYDQLADGSPAWIALTGRSASCGRGRAMDWVLPDPQRHVSSHHFDVDFREGGWWLTDVSTNGTFLQGHRHRLQGPHPLSHGERLVVGHYIIAVELQAAAPGPEAASPPAPPAAPPNAPADGFDWGAPTPDEADPWDFGAPLAPVDTAPRRPPAQAFDDAASDFLSMGRSPAPQMPPQTPPHMIGALPRHAPPMNPHMPAPHPPQAPLAPVAMPSDAVQRPPEAPPEAAPGAFQRSFDGAPIAGDGGPLPQVSLPPQPMPYPTAGGGPGALPPGAPAVQTPSAHSVAPPAPAQGAAQPGHDAGQAAADLRAAVLAAFCEGAGLDPRQMDQTDPVALARELGATVRVTTQEVMRMLHDRASVKQFTRGGERTMRSATGNNPMKFLPDAGEALGALFARPREGFLSGAAGYANALEDIRSHQMAVFAALQPALAELLSGLSPEEIEEVARGGSGMLGAGRRGKQWDLFVARWDEKAALGDHGMLDAFLQAFARAYIEANARGG